MSYSLHSLIIALALPIFCQAQDISLTPAAWNAGPSIPLYSGAARTGFRFDFISDPPGVTYVMTHYTPPAQPASLTMTFRVAASSDVIFHSVDQPQVLPCKVRPMVQTSQTILFSEQSPIPYEFRRWWAVDAYYALIQPAGRTVNLNAAFDPHLWSSVYGKRGDHDADSLYWFNYALNSIVKVGFTFGGNFYGHGVTLEQGTATFTLLGYQFVYDLITP